MSEADVESTVRTLLAVAGLTPSEPEIAVLVEAYPSLRAGVEKLHAVAEARYGSPALIFDPTPVFAEWAG
jgi:hypothetical protein